jgi:hypothetical protein
MNSKNNKNNNNYDMHKLNNTAKASYIKRASPEVKEIVEFAGRLQYVLEL